MGSNKSPFDIFSAAFPMTKSGFVINLDVRITAGIITINIIILIRIILCLAVLIPMFNDNIDSEVLMIKEEF